MDPKRTAVIVLAATAAIVVLISVIAAAIAVLPRENRYAIGSQASYTPPPAPVASPSTRAASTPNTPTTPTPTPAKRDLPGPVLAPASPQVVPNKTAVANKIRAVKVKGMTGSYSGSVVEVGSGKVVYAHNATRGYIPASTMKLLTSTAALSILGPEHTFTTSVVSAEAGADHFGRWRRSVPG